MINKVAVWFQVLREISLNSAPRITEKKSNYEKNTIGILQFKEELPIVLHDLMTVQKPFASVPSYHAVTSRYLSAAHTFSYSIGSDFPFHLSDTCKPRLYCLRYLVMSASYHVTQFPSSTLFFTNFPLVFWYFFCIHGIFFGIVSDFRTIQPFFVYFPQQNPVTI